MSIRRRGWKRKDGSSAPQTIIGSDMRRIGGLDAETYQTIAAAEKKARARLATLDKVESKKKGWRKDKRRAKIQLRQGSFRKVGGISLHQESADDTTTVLALDRLAGETTGIDFQRGDGFDNAGGIFIRRIDMGSAAETMGLHVGDEVLMINDVDVRNRGIDEVHSIMDAVTLVVLHIRKVALPDIISWQADALSVETVSSVDEAILSTSTEGSPGQTRHSQLTEPLPDAPVPLPDTRLAPDASTALRAPLPQHAPLPQQPLLQSTAPLSGQAQPTDISDPQAWADGSQAQRSQRDSRPMQAPSPESMSSDAESTIDPTTVANTIVNGISPMRSALRKAPYSIPPQQPRSDNNASAAVKSKTTRQRSVHFDLPDASNVPERKTPGQHPLAVRRGRPTPPKITTPDLTPAEAKPAPGRPSTNELIQPLPSSPEASSDTKEMSTPAQALSDDNASREARLDSLNHEADMLSERLEGLLRATHRPQSLPETRPATSANMSRAYSTGGMVENSRSSPRQRLPRAISDPVYPLEARSTEHSPTTGGDVVDWSGATTALDTAVYLDRDGDQSPTFGPVYTVELSKGANRLGMHIAGGCDTRLGALFVAAVAPGSAAALSGRIEVGDRFLKVGGVDVRGMSQDNLRRLISKRTSSSTLPLTFELMRIGQAQWRQLQRVAGIDLASSIPSSPLASAASSTTSLTAARSPMASADVTPPRSANRSAVDPDAYTLEPTYLEPVAGAQQPWPRAGGDYQWKLNAPPPRTGSIVRASSHELLSSTALASPLKQAPRSLSSDGLSSLYSPNHDRELYTLEPTYIVNGRHKPWQANTTDSASTSTSSLYRDATASLPYHDPASPLPPQPLTSWTSDPLLSSASARPPPAPAPPSSSKYGPADPRVLAERAMRLAQQVQTRSQQQRTAPDASSQPVDNNYNFAYEPRQTASLPSSPIKTRVSSLVVQPRLAKVEEHEDELESSGQDEPQVRLADVAAPIVRPQSAQSGSGRQPLLLVSDLPPSPLKEELDVDAMMVDDDQATQGSLTNGQLFQANGGMIRTNGGPSNGLGETARSSSRGSHVVISNVDDDDYSSEELDMDAPSPPPDPQTETKASSPPMSSSSAQRNSTNPTTSDEPLDQLRATNTIVADIAPRRRSLDQRNGEADAHVHPHLGHLGSDSSDDGADSTPSTPNISSDSVPRRNSTSGSRRTSERRASIRDFITLQKQELEKQQASQAQAEEEARRRRKQELIQQQKQADQARLRETQTALEQARWRAALDDADQAAQAEIDAALKRRGSVSRPDRSRRVTISTRTLERRQEFLKSPTPPRASSTSPTPRALPSVPGAFS
eukprot:TRINITY_DN10855_c0_g1_i2.p1 TRINITY_DN10855_c0_g1~~TRINITY_DN10855_c0_g1_i2.p1  ORF type:complete len:1398 (+),score=298.99 TRINITY_DN10855_c0_g1_i2:193-4194(+)